MLSAEQLKAKTGEFDLDVVRTLSLSGQGLASIADANASLCVNLLELDLSHNRFVSVDDHDVAQLLDLPLRKLSLAHNRLTSLTGLGKLQDLEHVFLQGNQISSVSCLKPLTRLSKLRSLYLSTVTGQDSNPVCQQSEYRDAVLRMFPHLKNLDGERIMDKSEHRTTSLSLSARRRHDVDAKPAASAAAVPKAVAWITSGMFDLPEVAENGAVSAVEENSGAQVRRDVFDKTRSECEALTRKADDILARLSRTRRT